jgi:hypothetical protein
VSGTYAAQTNVAVGRTRDEIERTLARYGATGFMFGQDGNSAVVGFLMRGRHVRFTVPLPDPGDDEFWTTPSGKFQRTEAQAAAAHATAMKQRWRALGLIIKAKLEAVDAQIVGFDEEFLAHLVLPDGSTVGGHVMPQMRAALAGQSVPALLPGSSR